MRNLLTLLFSLLLLAACTSSDAPSVSLYLAMQHGDIEQIKRHIRAGTDMNQITPDGDPPLHIATRQGKTAIVHMLLKSKQAGVAVDALNKQGHSAIYYAVLVGRSKMADVLLSYGAELKPDTLLLEVAAAKTPYRDAVNYLTAHGANTEVLDAAGDTPLIIAIRHHNHRLVRHLVTNGANVNVFDTTGKSALSIANSLSLSDISLLLQRNGAKN